MLKLGVHRLRLLGPEHRGNTSRANRLSNGSHLRQNPRPAQIRAAIDRASDRQSR